MKNTDDDELVIHDGRQSPTAASVQRGVCRMLANAGHVSIPEFQLVSGRRVDILSIDKKGLIWIIEIKSSLADFQADHKWPEYREYCDQLFFARPMELDETIFPQEAGLIVADAFGAEITRMPAIEKLSAARRKALTLLAARTAATRLQRIFDPGLKN
ncbi:MAG TPA: DNA repair protein MmcB-related protein [Rhizobiales bacterium]|nr:DNA repair protein MmcB-related protein [Hyphomicrobiales bacterium]